MYDKEKALRTIAERLEGLYWLVDAGMATEIYTNGKRTAQDIDIVTLEEDFEAAAKRLDGRISEFPAGGEGFIVFLDKYASGVTEGVQFEIMCGVGILKIYGRERRMNVTKEHLRHAKRIEYMGAEMNVAPREWVLAQKSLMGRDKDLVDIRLLTEDYESSAELLDLFFGMYQLNEEEKKAALSNIF